MAQRRRAQANLADRDAARLARDQREARDQAVTSLARQIQGRLEERYPLRPISAADVERLVIERVGPLLDAMVHSGIVDIEDLDDARPDDIVT